LLWPFWLQGPSVPDVADVAGDRLDSVIDQRGAERQFNLLRQRKCMPQKVEKDSRGPVNEEKEVVEEGLRDLGVGNIEFGGASELGCFVRSFGGQIYNSLKIKA
jgi:hypothetical protein